MFFQEEKIQNLKKQNNLIKFVLLGLIQAVRKKTVDNGEQYYYYYYLTGKFN